MCIFASLYGLIDILNLDASTNGSSVGGFALFWSPGMGLGLVKEFLACLPNEKKDIIT